MRPKTKIVCTLGPASRSIPMAEKLLRAGMNVARFNFSHGSHDYHQETLNNLKAAMDNTGILCAVMLDTKVFFYYRFCLFIVRLFWLLYRIGYKFNHTNFFGFVDNRIGFDIVIYTFVGSLLSLNHIYSFSFFMFFFFAFLCILYIHVSVFVRFILMLLVCKSVLSHGCETYIRVFILYMLQEIFSYSDV